MQQIMTARELDQAVEFLRSGVIPKPKRELCRKAAGVLARVRADMRTERCALGRVASFIAIRSGVKRHEISQPCRSERAIKAKREYSFLASRVATQKAAAEFVGWVSHDSVSRHAKAYRAGCRIAKMSRLIAEFDNFSHQFKMEGYRNGKANRG